MSLRILQLTNRLPYPLNDGGNIATYYVTHFLHRFGHKVTLASLNTKKHFADPNALASVAQVHAVYHDTTVTLPGLIKGMVGSLPYNISRFISPGFSDLLQHLLQENTFDIVQLEGIYLAIYLPLIRRHSKAPVVLRAHNVEHLIWQRLAANEPALHRRLYMSHLARKIRNFEEAHACLFDGIVAITDDDAAWFGQTCPRSRVISIPAGVTVSPDAATGIEELPLSVAMLGSLEWAPNVQGLEWFLAEVWPLLLLQLPEATLHIAGKNPPAALLNLKAPNTTVHGMVPDAEAFLLQHPVLAVPLHAGGGMRLKVVEAMALGRCIVSTRIGIEGIPVKQGEHVLLADSASDFANALLLALSDRAMRQRLGRNAHKLAARTYGWEGLVRKFEEFYQALL